MAEQPNIKPDARKLVDGLPDTATWDDSPLLDALQHDRRSAASPAV